MDPVRLIPAAEAIPSFWGWFEALLWVTFIVHLIFMNLAVGSGVLALCGRGKRRELAQTLGHRMPTFLALTVNFGVAPLLFVQVVYGQFLYTSSVLMAGWWLSAIAAVIGGYYAAYVHDAQFEKKPGPAHLALALSLLFLVYTGFLFSNNMTLMLRPTAWTAYFRNPNGSLLNLADPTLWPRFAHIMLAAPAVAGLYAALLGERKRRPDWVEYGLAWFTRVTMLQILIGLWTLLSQPGDVLHGLLGGSAPAATFLALGIVAGLAALAAGLRKKPRAAAKLLLVGVAMMAATRAQVRLLTLDPYFHPANLPLSGDDGALAMFLVAFAVGLAALAWMIKTYAKSGRRG